MDNIKPLSKRKTIYIQKVSFLFALLIFVTIHVLSQYFFSEYSFPNWPTLHGLVHTSLSHFLIMTVGLSYEMATSLDVTNPSPRGVIAFILGAIAYLMSRNRLTKIKLQQHLENINPITVEHVK